MGGRPSILVPAAVLAVSVLTGGWFLQRGTDQGQNVYVQVRLFQEVVDHVRDRYVDPVDPGELYQSAIDGVLQDLGDPNTAFLPAQEWENLRIRTEGEYGGVGLEIVSRGGWITVVTTIPGTPSERAGIRAGDQIVEVEGESMEGWDSQQAVEALRGTPGTAVNVQIRRPGVETPIPFTITRAVIQIRSVPFATFLDEGIGYVPLQGVVSEVSSQEVRHAVDSLRAQGLRGLVLDLRGNPGGVLDQGIAVSDLFLDRGLTVLETRGRAPGQNQEYHTSAEDAYAGLPLVVLVDERSASASEIVAGALQDHDRALLIGATSFGKGSVQTLYRLSGGNVLRLTTARWYTPAGRSIQKLREEQLALGENGVLTLDRRLASRPDTAGREVVRSMAGRPLYGGGGITPDLLVMPDTLTTDEQDAVRTLYREAGAFNVALFNYAVRYVQQSPSPDPDFRLSDRDLDAFHEALGEWNVEVEPETLRRAARYVRTELEREIALQAWGQEGEFRRSVAYDTQLRRAVELLRMAQSPDALFRVAGVPWGAPADASESAHAAGSREDERRDGAESPEAAPSRR